MTTTDLSLYGGRDEIKELGFRLRQMMPSAQSFTEGEALAVAQIAHAHKLDPFNGEVWGIKGYSNGEWKWYGVMVGIKGLRKCAHRAAAEENASYWLDFVLTDPKKYHITQEGAIVYECLLRDSANMGAYGKAIHNLTDSGIPYKEAVEMVGKAPVVVGIGAAWPAEKSKMGLHQRAKKRAEADALKTRYDVDFGSARFTVEEEGEIVDAENLPDDFAMGVDAEYPHKSELENLHDLGVDTEDDPPIPQSRAVPRPEPQPEPAPPARDTRAWSVAQKEALIKAGLAKNDFAAKGMLGLSNLPVDAQPSEIVEWGKIYRSNREYTDEEGKVHAKMTAEQAAAIANGEAAPA